MKFEELIKDRYSCRKFKNTPVEKEKIEKILEAALVAPEMETPEKCPRFSKIC